MRSLVLAVMIFGFAFAAQAVEKRELLKTTTSWDGKALAYPAGQAEITAVHLTAAPGEAMEFHCHPMPTLGYMVAGEIEVALRTGETKRFKQGEALTEVVSRWHRGRNVSESEPAELVVFYTGAKGLGDTIAYSEAEKRCGD